MANQNTHVATSMESNSPEYFSEFSKTQEDESYQAVTSVDAQSDSNNDNRTDNDLCSFDDLMDKIFFTSTTSLSPCSEIDELLNIYDADLSQPLVSNST